MTHCINLIHITLHLHEEIPYDYLLMACTRTALEIHIRDVNRKKNERKITLLIEDFLGNISAV